MIPIKKVDIINIDKKTEPDRVKYLSDLPFDNGSLFPNTLTYKDIDNAFLEFVKGDIKFIEDGIEIPSFFITQQRFSEFSKTWEYLDDNSNLLLNFKLIARENNPKQGSGYNNLSNIASDYSIDYLHVKTFDGVKNGIDIYQMKQPYNVDLLYDIRFITNKYETLNNVNIKILELFKAKQCYLNVNGYHLPMMLESISDESSKDLNDRKFYSQVFNIKILAYIINKSDFNIKKAYNTVLTNGIIDLNNKKPSIFMADIKEGKHELIFEFPPSSSQSIYFYSDNNYKITKTIPSDGLDNYSIYINKKLIKTSRFTLSKGDKFHLKIIKKRDSNNVNVKFLLNDVE